MRPYFYLLFLALLTGPLTAQSNSWSLDRAVGYALENNLQVRRLNYGVDNANLIALRNRRSRLPVVSGSTSGQVQFGRTINPVTNDFEQRNILSQNYGLTASMSFYGGGVIANNIRQAEINAETAQVDARVTSNDIALQVANSYLTILLLREQVANARTQLALFDDQLANIDALIEAGSRPAGDRYDLLAQQASARRALVDFENQAEVAQLNLQLLLELDPTEDFDVIAPNIDEITEADLFGTYNLDEVLASARQVQPTIRAAELRRSAAEVDRDIARAALLPEIGAQANVNTFFSRALTGDLPFQQPSYGEQLDQNLGQSVGLFARVSIYGQDRNRINMQLAELGRQTADLDVEVADNQLRSDVTQALANLRGARETYRAAQVSLDAAQTAFTLAERSFNAGASNNLNLVTAANQLEQARTEFTRTKYQLIFNREVVQFYLGQGLSLD